MTPEQKAIIEDIRGAAEALQRTVNGIPAGLLDQRPQPEAWSVTEILIHTRNVVMLAYGLRLRRLLHEDGAVFADYEEDQHLLSLSRPQLPAAEILEMIVIDHQQTARLLSHLSDADWERQGTHPQYGSMSIQFLAQRLAAHAFEHLEQIRDTVQALS